MTTIDGSDECQLPCIPVLATGRAQVQESLLRKAKLAVRRRMSPQVERTFKTRTNKAMNRVRSWRNQPERPTADMARFRGEPLQPGDLVRVRSLPEIESTLNNWRQTRGCTFMPEQAQYCGTTHRVHKRLERFVDERDLTVKTAKGIVMLDGVICHGTAAFGPCDRSCLMFWREEWLEKVDAPAE